MRYFAILISLLLVVNSCTQVSLLEPEYSDGSILTGTSEISEQIKKSIEGIYKISDGSNEFGTEVAFKWHGETLAVYGSKLGSYFLLSGGVKDTVFFFEGTWRHMQNLDVGLLRLQISVDDGALNLWNNSVTPRVCKIKGFFW